MCTRLVRWVRAHDAAGRVLASPSQTPNLIEGYGLTRPQVDREAWAVESGHRPYAGAAAVNRVLVELGGPWRLVGILYHFPPVRWLEDPAYRWLAAHRHRFARWGVVPECDEPGVACR